MTAMSTAEAFRILHLQAGTSLAEVKTAFRRLAFQFHPDLNPAPDAPARFRQINEAYVLLSRTLASPGGQDAAGAQPSGNRTAEAEPRAGAAQGAQAYERQQRRSQAGRARVAERQAAWSRAGTPSEEEVLRDLLKDPFARQVFDDLYRQIRRDRPGYRPPKEYTRRRLQFQWGRRTFTLDLSRGLFGGIKAWLRGQMDAEHTAYFPVQHLLPGRTIRLNVKRFSGGERTVEVTLPADFIVGRPIRLKGLGRKLGPFSGDLYLRILAK